MWSESYHHTIKVLWTGGWDSTFRILELALTGNACLEIMPFYISGDNRKSETRELEAMNTLLPLLRQASNARIDDLTVIDKKDIPQNIEITHAFERMRSMVTIGTQYEWIARLAVMHPGIEIGIEKPNGEYAGCFTAIEKTGELICRDGTYSVNPHTSSRECCLLFQNISFPLISRTETDMAAAVQEWGHESLMEKIWFCHNPIKGEPCGYCRPCQQKMECEMNWLLPISGQKRYHVYKRTSKLFGTRIGVKLSDILYRS